MPSELSSLMHYVTTCGWMLRRDVATHMLAILERHGRSEKLSATDVGRIRAERDEREQRKQQAMCADGLGAIGLSRNLGEKSYAVVGRVGIVPVQGLIAKYASMVGGISSPEGMSVDQIIRASEQAYGDPKTQKICYVIDSPGGTVAGGDELVYAMRELQASTKKPTVAFCYDMACSGGYLMAAQCKDGVYCSNPAQVGCLGVYTVMCDTSKMYADMGIKMTLVASGDVKGQGADGVPINDAAKQDMATSIQAMADWYFQTVAEGRGVDVAKIRELGTGGVWTGQAAVDVGLCDGVCTLRELIDLLNSNDAPAA